MTQLTLYNCTAERNRLNKGGYLEKVIDLQGVIKEDFSLTNPSIAVALDPNTVLMLVKSGNLVIDDNDDITTKDGLTKVTYSYRSKVLRANYAYIPELNRYYFIEDISTQNGKLWTISMSVDVLMSYYAEIGELDCFVARNENTYNKNLNDPLMSWASDRFVDEYTPTKGEFVNVEFATTLIGNFEWCITISTVFAPQAGITYDTPPADVVSFPDTTAGLPDIDTSRFSNYASSTPFEIEKSVLTHIVKELNGNQSTKSSFVNSMIAFPFKALPKPPLGAGVTQRPLEDIYFGKDTLEYDVPGSSTPVKANGYYLEPFLPYAVIADFRITKPYDNFRSYSPLTEYEVFIPFVGWVKLDPNQIFSDNTTTGDRLYIYYSISYEDGSATAYIYNATKKRMIYSQACQVGVKIPFSSTNAEQIANQRNALALNTALGVISSGLTTAIGVSSGNPVAIAGGIMGMTKTVSNAIQANHAMYESAKQSFGAGNTVLPGMLEVHVRKSYALPSVAVGSADFAKQYGLPLMHPYKLKNLHGYTLVGSVRIVGIKATASELRSIEAILTSGVIL